MTIVNLNAVAWGIPSNEVVNLQGAQAPWPAAFAAGGKGNKGNRTPKDVKKKTETRNSYEKVIRIFVKRWINNNPLISDDERVSLQVTVPDTVRTRASVPATIPMVDISNEKSGKLIFRFRQEADESGSSGRGKPKGVTGMKIYYKLGEPAPADKNNCNVSVTATRSPYTLAFKPSNIGSRFYCFCCWVNARGEEGSVTTVISAVIS